ncbi:MAG: serpin family protein [Armatimonadetes bacterium]|nr:serpin family protein [Armatimonadota bacterium]
MQHRLLPLAMLCVLVGCRNSAHGPTARQPRRAEPSVSDEAKPVIAAHNDLGFRLFRELHGVQPDANLVLSPLSPKFPDLRGCLACDLGLLG